MDTKKRPGENPEFPKHPHQPEVPIPPDPEEPLNIPEEDPDIIPDEEPFEPPPYEVPPPGERP